jgi:hypothetical protein
MAVYMQEKNLMNQELFELVKSELCCGNQPKQITHFLKEDAKVVKLVNALPLHNHYYFLCLLQSAFATLLKRPTRFR